MQDEAEYQIRQRAYDLWAGAGRPHGKHLDYWTAAEREFHAGGVKSGEGSAASEEAVPEAVPLLDTGSGGTRSE